MGSRLIVKNLPKNITSEQLKSHFSTKGTITDLKLKFNKENKFRGFAFIGFKDEHEAKVAKEYFNQTFVNNSKITVDYCLELGEGKSVKEKYLNKRKRSSADDDKSKINAEEDEDDEKSDKKKSKNKKQKFDPFDEFKDDPQFEEFIKVQRNLADASKQVWSNDADTEKSDKNEKKASKKQKKNTEEEASNENKQKIKPTPFEYTVKIRGLPLKCKKRNVKDFFFPLKPISIRCPIKGVWYLSFADEKDLNKALIKHRGFLDGHRVDVVKIDIKKEENEQEKEEMNLLSAEDNNADQQQEQQKSCKKHGNKSKTDDAENNGESRDEEICDSGRIFVRNLCYTSTEDDLRKLFEKYGDISELIFPIDSFTKKPKGFAIVTFMFPENAVTAFTELDGTIFQGRVIHLIPGKSKPEKTKAPYETDEGDNKSSFKKEKNEKKRDEAVKTHNWNSLFLGADAVANIMSEKYQVDKYKLLADKDSKESIAVRMALGETQIVNETKQFLLNNGIDLDSFKDNSLARSKTTFLIKNLPAKTKINELFEMFSKFGLVKKVLLPPTGVTAILEMQEEAEARQAFKGLAYTNFKHVPLYLEWAPGNVFDATKQIDNSTVLVDGTNNEDDEKATKENDDKEEEKQEEEEKPEENTTIFVKNLDTSLDEKTIKEHFEKCGKVYKVNIATKRQPNGKLLPLGYAFVQYKKRNSALKAMKQLQNSNLNDSILELRLSNKSMRNESDNSKETMKANNKNKTITTGTKLIIKNIPFEATVNDVKELFSSFGELKSIRLPKKLSGTGSHRGFGFAEFLTKNGAKKAFDSLSQSTHLYGRRLVLDWALTDEDEKNR